MDIKIEQKKQKEISIKFVNDEISDCYYSSPDNESSDSNDNIIDNVNLNNNEFSDNENVDDEYNAFIIYKKEKDLLTEQNYNKTIIDNEYLKNKLNKTLIETKNNTKIIECLKKLFEYKKFIKLSDFIISDTNVFDKNTNLTCDIHSKYTNDINLLSYLHEETILIDDTFIPGLKDYFNNEIIFIKENLIKHNYSNYKLLNKYVSNKYSATNSDSTNSISHISEIKTKEISRDRKSVIYVGLFLFFGLSVVCKYFIK